MKAHDRGLPKLKRIDKFRWAIPKTGAMQTDGLVFASAVQVKDLETDESLRQVANVACLPGIVGPSIAMPDIHWGYGFPIGGVAAFDPDHGVVSPGGVGYDINCGVRLLSTPLAAEQVRPRLRELVDELFRTVPSGVGSARSDVKLGDPELDRVLVGGAARAVEMGYGRAEDLAAIEAGGRLAGADPAEVSKRARDRGRSQLGTVGSGNHFVEVDWIDETYDDEAASALGLGAGTVAVLIHTGSRGLGHQVCDDHLDAMLAAARKYKIPLPDPQLCCAPLSSPEARAYWGAMNAAANFAFANRQLITFFVRQAFAKIFGEAVAEGMSIVYDVAHNIAKLEEHEVEGRRRRVCVHRKGATRALPPGHPELAPRYREIGQPVLVPGDMGRASFVLLGLDRAASETFSSCCHGAGRRLSRHAAKKLARPRNLVRELEAQGILVRAASRATVDEEMPDAYKDVEAVVDVVAGAGLAKKLVRLRPMAVVKG
ncbi:MAG TPA: RtcB family protein [Thermoanaerobaculia bacterium]|nr:RtcB family protein [Thermoanaerobaculia bacterium]